MANTMLSLLFVWDWASVIAWVGMHKNQYILRTGFLSAFKSVYPMIQLKQLNVQLHCRFNWLLQSGLRISLFTILLQWKNIIIHLKVCEKKSVKMKKLKGKKEQNKPSAILSNLIKIQYWKGSSGSYQKSKITTSMLSDIVKIENISITTRIPALPVQSHFLPTPNSWKPLICSLFL